MLHKTTQEIGCLSLKAARELVRLSSTEKNRALSAMAEELLNGSEEIKCANEQDMELACSKSLSTSLLDRLELNDDRISQMSKAISEVVQLEDPVGEILKKWTRPNGLEITKVRVPIGVVGIIYESRPNVTADAAALCIKTSNAVILRGGSESINSNKAIAKALQAGGAKSGLPNHCVQLITNTDREAVRELVQMVGVVDLIIPRGGESLITAVTDMSKVPVIKHYKGVCHTYVDISADMEKAVSICENAKCQRPGVCNAMETMLVHEQVAADFLPILVNRLSSRGVEFRGDTRCREIVPTINEAVEDDWFAEYLDLVLAVRIVPGVDAAIEHINRYGSHHSDAIVTESEESAHVFERDVDSAAVYVNASTRFTDGGEFGMGAELGISTDKLHARGPMGLEELTTYKYVVRGNGQVRK